ncbi:unnamed protein product [Polarella glacialis]|uniref:RNase H type-1 domain-containing protein n=1 Tax=Polarella glacialis TaxID=89957 RepID=A0A813H1F4_POLGL|nr:unnamed protein product [Polarella glacialis]
MSNIDLWRELHSLMESRAGDVVVSKVKGHASERDVRSGRVKREDKVGNDAAALLAVEGAKSHAVSASAVAAQKQRVAVIEDVQRMMLDISLPGPLLPKPYVLNVIVLATLPGM